MTIALAQSTTPVVGASGALTTTAMTTAATGSTFRVVFAAASNSAVTVTDSKGNTYTQIGTTITDGNSKYLSRYYCQNGVGGAGHTFTATQATSSSATLIAQEITGGLTSGILGPSDYNTSTYQAPGVGINPGPLAVTVPSGGALAITDYVTSQYATSITFSTNPAYTIDQAFTNGQSGAGLATATAHNLLTASGTYGTVWYDGVGGTSMATDIDIFYGATAGPTVVLSDGTSVVHSYAATGSGGVGMPAVTVGQLIDVIVFSNSSTATTCTCTDQLGNTYTLIDSRDYTSVGAQLFHYMSIVTHAGTPVITGQLGLVPANVAIAAAVNSGINTGNPFTTGNVASNNQYPDIVAIDGQTSGALPSPALLPALCCAWGWCSAFASAPAAGTNFANIGTLWGALGTAPSLTYETQTLVNNASIPATFSPSVTNRALTMAALFNLSSTLIIPSTGRLSASGNAPQFPSSVFITPRTA